MLVLDRAGMIDRGRSFISSGGSVPAGTGTGIPITTPGNLQRPAAGTVPLHHRHMIKCIRPIVHPCLERNLGLYCKPVSTNVICLHISGVVHWPIYCKLTKASIGLKRMFGGLVFRGMHIITCQSDLLLVMKSINVIKKVFPNIRVWDALSKHTVISCKAYYWIALSTQKD
ncbi:hypothetical protein SUGI_0575780 [Cryptomeria japonica]|nr:hypothetical protein SUGI_0575780 [Cryptomeria japonica]